MLRKGTEKYLKHLHDEYQLAIIRKMGGKKFMKFERYLRNSGIEFDAIYKDNRKDSKDCPQDYDCIMKDFEKFNNENNRPVLLLTPHDVDIDSYNEILETIHLGQILFNNSFVTLLVPHMKFSGSITVKRIYKAVNKINTAKVISKDSLGEELLVFKTNFFYKKLKAEANNEAQLLNRLTELKEKRKNKVRVADKGVNLEMISEFMSTNLTAYNCIHLANQYSRLINSVYGNMSKAALIDNKLTHTIKEHVNISNEVITLIILKDLKEVIKVPKVIAMEEYRMPWLNLNSYCQKKTKRT